MGNIKDKQPLSVTNPEIAQEWDSNKNAPLTPGIITAGSNKKVWWLGECGHEWQASIADRVGSGSKKPTNCPYCNSEWHTSFPEQAVFYYIKKAFPDAINGDQDTIGMELDIYIPSISVAVEYDGAWHKKQLKQKMDIKKNRLCKEASIQLIRIQEDYLKYDDCICLKRSDSITSESLSQVINDLLRILNNDSVIADVAKDEQQIFGLYMIKKKENSLLTLHPEIAKEWHPIKNAQLTADKITTNSRKKVWWMCSNGHEWQARIDHRVKMHSGCPYCSGRLAISGLTDIQSKYPQLITEWDYTKNVGLLPSEITSKSEKKVWWICSQGHSYSMPVCNKICKSKITPCPICSGKRILPGYNDLKTLFPEIAREWHPTKNGELIPESCAPYSNKNVWWKCVNGHSWYARISSRTNGHNGCPYCSGRKK